MMCSNRSGAANVDSACTGTTMGDYLKGNRFVAPSPGSDGVVPGWHGDRIRIVSVQRANDTCDDDNCED